MSVRQNLAANIVLDLDFRKGTLLDQSGNSNDATPTSTPQWVSTRYGKSLKCDTIADLLTVSDSAELQPTSGAIFVFGEFRKQISSRIFSKRDGGGTHIEFNKSATQLWAYDGTNAPAAVVSTEGAIMIGVVFDTNSVRFYKDGIFLEEITSTFQVVANDAPIKIGNIFTGSLQSYDPMNEVLYLDSKPTDQQISELYDEWLQEGYIGTLPKRNFQYPELLAYPDLETDSIWTKGTGWSIANSKASSDGSQVADSDLTQDIGTVGKAYTIEYRVSNYSAGNITALAGSAEGTDRTANGVYTEYLTASESTEIGVRADLNFVGDIGSEQKD